MERSARPETRNRMLGLPSAVAIQALPIEQRRPLGTLLRELAVHARANANESWKRGKGPMAAYWMAVSIYARHTARVIDPRSPGSFVKGPTA